MARFAVEILVSERGLAAVGATAQRQVPGVQNLGKTLLGLEVSLTGLARLAAQAFGGFTAINLFGRAIQESRDFETGLVGIGKTTGILGAELRALGADISAMATRMPVATNELLELGKAAGQVGVEGRANLNAYIETVAKLGRVSDLSGDTAVSALAAIQNITGEAKSTVKTLAGVIVDLGNKSIATESVLAHMGQEVAKALAPFDIGSVKSVAIANALASIGAEAEAASTVVGHAFRSIDQNTREGAKHIKDLEAITGIAGKRLREVFDKDAVQAFEIFLAGVRRLKEQNKDLAGSLDRIGLGGERALKVLPTLALHSDLLGDSLKWASEQAATGGQALEREFEAGLKTADSAIILLENNIKAALRSLGDGMTPALREAALEFQENAGTANDLAVILGTVLGDSIQALTALLSSLSEEVRILTDLWRGLSSLIAKGLPAPANLQDVFRTGLDVQRALLNPVAAGGSLIERFVGSSRETQALVEGTQANLRDLKPLFDAYRLQLREAKDGTLEFGAATEAMSSKHIAELDVFLATLSNMSADDLAMHQAGLERLRAYQAKLLQMRQDLLNAPPAFGLTDRLEVLARKLVTVGLGIKQVESVLNVLRVRADGGAGGKPSASPALDDGRAAARRLESVKQTIAALEAEAKAAKAVYDARLRGGKEAADNEEAYAKALAKVVALEERLKDIGGLSPQQRDAVLKAIQDTEHWQEETKQLEKVEKDFGQAIVQSARAMRDWAAAGAERKHQIALQREELDKSLAAINRETALLREMSNLTGLDLSRAMGLAEVEDGVNRVVSAMNRVKGETDEAFRVRVAGAAREARAALMELANERFGVELRQYVEEPMKQAAASIKSALLDAIATAVASGKVQWGNLWKSFLQTAIRALEEWLIRWIIAHRAAQAEAARTAAVNAAAGSSGGGGGGWLSTASGLFSRGGGGTTGGGAVAGGGPWGANSSWAGRAGTSGTGTTASGGAWSTWGTFAAYAFLAWVGIKIFQGWTKAKVKWKLDEGAMRELQTTFKGIATDLGLLFADFNAAAVRIEKSKHGFNVKAAILGISEFFRSYEEAIEFAKVQAIKLADLSRSASDFVQAAIRASRARTIESLKSDIEFARMLETQNLPDIGRQISDMTNTLILNTQRVMELFSRDLPNMVLGLQSVFTNFASGLQAAYNSLMGIKENPAEIWERNRDAYNAQLRITKVQLALLYAEIQTKLALIAIQSEYLRMLGGGGRPGLESRPTEGVRPVLSKGGQQTYRDPGEPPIGGTMEELYNWILAFIQYTLAHLPGLITGGKPPGVGGGRGGGRVQARTTALDHLADLRARAIGETAVTNLEFTRSLAAWREEAKKAKLSAAELEEGERLLREERERIIQERRAGIFRDVAAFGGVSPFQAVKDEANDLRDSLRAAFKDGTIKWREFKAQMDLLNAAERERLHLLEQETLAGVMEGLAKYVTDETLRTELLQEAAVIKFQMEYASLMAQTELLRLQGVNVALLDAAIRNIGEHLPEILEGIRNGVAGVREEVVEMNPEWAARNFPGGQATGETDAANLLRDARAILDDWKKLGKDPFRLELDDFARDLDTLRRGLGDTAEVAEAAAAKLNDIISRYLDPIREYRRSLQFSELSTLTGEQQFFASQQAFRDALMAIQGGDMSGLGNITALAQQYGERGRSYTAGSGFRFIMSEIEGALANLETLIPGWATSYVNQQLGSAGNPMAVDDTGTVTAITGTTQAITTGNNLMLDELRTMKTSLQRIDNSTGMLYSINGYLSGTLSVRNVA